MEVGHGAWPCASQRVEHMPRPRLAFRPGPQLSFLFDCFFPFPLHLPPLPPLFVPPLSPDCCCLRVVHNLKLPGRPKFGWVWFRLVGRMVGWSDGWMVGTLPCTCSCVQCDRIFFFLLIFFACIFYFLPPFFFFFFCCRLI